MMIDVYHSAEAEAAGHRLSLFCTMDVEVTCEDWSRRLDVAFEPIDSELALMSNELYRKR
jgi:hypothetical protein